jgi:uncharacterized protein (UPF0332 family)
MSPRSEEFLERARSRLGSARRELDGGDPSAVVSLAYYAMLYAARAALSERDRYAKTHAGTWHVFREEFVTTGEFAEALAAAGPRREKLREEADYEAAPVSVAEAGEVVADAERFLEAVTDLLGA